MRTVRRNLRICVPVALVMLLLLAFTARPTVAGTRRASIAIIETVSPSSAPAGTIVLIWSKGNDEGFGSRRGTVTFNGRTLNPGQYGVSINGEVVSWSNDLVKVKVPEGASGSGLTVYPPDDIQAYFNDFYVEPRVNEIFPRNALSGQYVTVKGSGFGLPGTENQVHFYNNIKGDFAIPMSNFSGGDYTYNRLEFKTTGVDPGSYQVYFRTRVPLSAGDEVVKSNRLPLRIEDPFSITSVSPNPCPAGGIVTIEGSGFGDVKQDNIDIYLRNEASGEEFKKFNFIQWTPTSIKMQLNGLPNFEGTYHIVVSRGVSSIASEVKQSASELELTVIPGPPPPDQQFTPTSRTWAHDSIGVPKPAKNWYLTEGSTSNGDETWVLVQNPNDQAAEVTLTYITSRGNKEMPAVTIPAKSRTTCNAAAAFSDTAGVSVKVESNNPIVAEKAVYGNSRHWAHESVGVSEPSKTWYLAEGCTAAGFSTRISVMNPGNSQATVTLTYMTPSGPKPGPSETLPANSRKSYDVADKVPNAWEVSTRVSSDKPVVAERAMFGDNGAWAHDSIGVPGSETTWYLAEGCTASSFETWVLVQNPNDSQATVTLTYMTPSGPQPGPVEPIAPNSRKTYEVARTVPGAWEVSTKVTSDKPVVVERAMYGNGRSWAHESVGVSSPSDTWYLAEGCTLSGMETWILLQNPNDKDVQFKIAYNTSSGLVYGPAETLPAKSRRTFTPTYSVYNSADVSTFVESDRGIVVERAMYGDPK